MTGITLWIMLGMLLPVILITAITPIVTRKTEAFGVTIPEEVKGQPFIVGHIKRYIVTCILLGIVMIAGLFLVLRFEWSEAQTAWSYAIVILAYLLLTFFAYYTSHRKIKEWKLKQEWFNEQQSSQKIVVQTNFHQKRRAISIAWYIPHLIMVAITAAYSLIRYDDFPEQLPMKYSFSGEVTSYVEKSLQSVLTLSFVAFAMVIVFLVSHYSIIKSKQVIESEDPNRSLERNRIFRYVWSVFTAGAGFLVVLVMCIGQLTPLQLWDEKAFMIYSGVAVGLIVISSLLLSIKLGQGGSRIVLKDQSNDHEIKVADLDQYWKAGIFYYNPNDPAIFVEKRFGIGWSINFGNFRSWLIMLGILAIVLLPALILSI